MKERIIFLQKRTAKQENAVLSQVFQQKKYMQINRQSRKCHIFVRNIDKNCVFVCHYKYNMTPSRRSFSFTQTISMGQHQCPKCEQQFARSDSLRRHLTSGVCSEDMESETMSENENSTMPEESDAETSNRHQKEDIFGKYEDKEYGICDGSDTDDMDEDDEDQHYSRKKSKLIIGICWLMELINAYKTLSMKLCIPQLRTIQTLAQKWQRSSLRINWNIDTDQRSLIATGPSLQFLKP